MEKTFYINKKKYVNAELKNLIIEPIFFQFYEELLNLEYIAKI